MGTKSKQTDGKPTSKQIAEELAKLEPELAELESQAAAADRAAVDCAVDSGVYAAAAERASVLRQQRDAMAVRIKRLREAHDATSKREQSEYIARLLAEESRLHAEWDRVGCDIKKEREAEEERHKAVIADLDLRERAASEAAEAASQAVRRARNGLTEENGERLRKLYAELNSLSGECDGKAQQDRRDKARERLATLTASRNVERLNSNNADTLRRIEESIKAAQRELDELDAELRNFGGTRICQVHNEINAIEATIRQ